MDVETVQRLIRYNFADSKILKQALVHRSYLNEKHKEIEVVNHNERLEFLGDAVLELIVTDYLFANVQEDEGLLTSLRASLVNYKSMAIVGMRLGLDEHILISKGEKEDSGRVRNNIVADCLEAVIGAMYLDGGLSVCTEFITREIISMLEEIMQSGSYRDHKTIMQEFCQKHTKITPRYRVISSIGKDHEKIFRVGVWVGPEKLGEGEGRSKQDAETEAAEKAMEVLLVRYPVNE